MSFRFTQSYPSVKWRCCALCYASSDTIASVVCPPDCFSTTDHHAVRQIDAGAEASASNGNRTDSSSINIYTVSSYVSTTSELHCIHSAERVSNGRSPMQILLTAPFIVTGTLTVPSRRLRFLHRLLRLRLFLQSLFQLRNRRAMLVPCKPKQRPSAGCCPRLCMTKTTCTAWRRTVIWERRTAFILWIVLCRPGPVLWCTRLCKESIRLWSERNVAGECFCL